MNHPAPHPRTAACLLAVLLCTGMTMTDTARAAPATTATTDLAGSPLVAEWTGPYGGVPPWDRVKVADFQAALEYGMAEELREVDAIANNPAPPTFENTIAALQRAGKALERTSTLFGIHTDTLSTPEVQAIETAVAPKFAAHGDRISQNAALFARVEAVYQTRTTSGLTAEQQRLVREAYLGFVRSGAQLDAAKNRRLSASNQERAGRYTRFSQNFLAD